MIAKIFKALGVAILTMTPIVRGQMQPNIGVQAGQPYSNAQFDSVNLITGNVTTSIPIASYPQKGNLPPINFSFLYNSNPFYREATCDSYSEECVVYYTAASPPQSAFATVDPLTDNYTMTSPVINMQLLYDSGDICNATDPELVIECVAWYDANIGVIMMDYNRTITLSDDTGATHSLYFDANNPNWARSTDGSGYAMYQVNNYNAWDFMGFSTPSGATLYDGSGNYVAVPGLGQPYSPTILTDIYGNSINSQYTPIPGSQGYLAQVVDSIGRTFSGPVSDPGTKCPAIGNSLQTLAGAAKWSLPGINGGTEDYILCYTSFNIHPGFFDFGAPPSYHCNDYYYNFWNIDAPDTQFTVASGTEPFNEVIACDQELGNSGGIQAIVLPNGSYWGFLYDAGQSTPCDNIDGSCTTVSYGTLQKVILPSGATVDYTYNNIASNWSQAYSMNYRVLSQRSVTDVNNIARSTQYSYSTPSLFTNNYTAPPSTAETDPLGNDIVHVFGAFGSNSSTPGGQDPYAGQVSLLETETDHYQGSSAAYTPVLLSKDIVDYAGSTKQHSVSHYEGGTLTSSVTYDYPSYSTYAYYICESQVASTCNAKYPFTISRSSPSVTTVSNGDGSVISQTTSTPLDIAHPAYANINMLDKVSSLVVADGSGSSLAETDYGYDEGSTSTLGELTSVSRKLTSTTSVKSTYAYNADGTLSDSYSPNGVDTHISSYQCNGLYPLSTTVAYGSTTTQPETTSNTVDCGTGKVLSATDANGIVTNYEYDALLRPKAVKVAVGTSQEAWTAYSYPSMNEVDVAQDKASKGDGLLTSSMVMDGVGHVTQTTSPGGAKQDLHYNLNGLLDWKTNPYYSTNDATYGKTHFTYDALGRKTIETEPDSNVLQWCYQNVASTMQTNCHANGSGFANASWVDRSDESGNHWQSASDGGGRLVSVTEPGALTTGYGYDGLGNLVSVLQAGNGSTDASRSRSFSYDPLSRLIFSQNPETGTITYGYLANGSLCAGDVSLPCSKTDARGITTRFSYDALNRLTQKSMPVVGTTNGNILSCYQYDAISGAPSMSYLVGHMAVEWTQNGSACPSAYSLSVPALTATVFMSYDAMGHLLNSQQCISGTCQTSPFTQTQMYDLAGNMTSWTDGRGLMTFGQQFDTAGRPASVTNTFFGNGMPPVLFSAQGYTAAGALQNWNVGSYLNFNRTYDTRLRVNSETVNH